MKRCFILLSLLAFTCAAKLPDVRPELADNDISTSCIMPARKAVALFRGVESPLLSYQVYSSDGNPGTDPAGWVLKGSDNGKKWVEIDRRSGVEFCSRFQEQLCVLARPADYKEYKIVFEPAKGQESIAVGEVRFLGIDEGKGWEDFTYPQVNFINKAPESEGSGFYSRLVQNPEEYVKYHARKVAGILYYTAGDGLPEVGKVNYILRDMDGVAYKGGNHEAIDITFSTRHIAKSAGESLFKLDFETRGVLYHELTHGYQYEPKGCGDYGSNKVFWSFIEGVADAVRAHAGHFDMNTRRPGGNWMDGYRTTGFFIQWMTLGDPDAIRKFHRTALELDVWSWDAAIKLLYGSEASIESKWEEYQQWLVSGENKNQIVYL